MNRTLGIVLMGVMGASLGQAFAQTGWLRDYASFLGGATATGNALFMTGTLADKHWLFKIDPATGDTAWTRSY